MGIKKITGYYLVVLGVALWGGNVFGQMTPTPTLEPTVAVAPTYNPPFTLITGEAGTVLASNAELNGTIFSGSDYVVDCVGFEYGTSSKSYTKSVCEGDGHLVTGENSRSQWIYRLSPATTYYFRLYTQEGLWKAYGEEKSFTTAKGSFSDSGTVTTCEATDVMSTSATLNGTVMWKGGIGYGGVHEYFEYGTTSGSFTNSIDPRGCGEGMFAAISGLLPRTTYYYRLYIMDKTEEMDGNEKFFTTLAEGATLTPIVTSTPECTIKRMKVTPRRFTLKRGQNGTVTVILKGVENCSLCDIITATSGKKGSNVINIDSACQVINGKDTFEFDIGANLWATATGKVRIIFKAGNLKKVAIVEVQE